MIKCNLIDKLSVFNPDFKIIFFDTQGESLKIDSKDVEATINSCYEEHAHFSQYRAAIDESELKNSEATDKAVLTISSASLGLILALTKDINLQSIPSYNFYLHYGWFIILAAMACVLGSMFLSGVLHVKHRNIIDKILSNRGSMIKQLQQADLQHKQIEVNDKLHFTSYTKLNYVNRSLHYLAPVLLIIGVVIIGLFFQTYKLEGKNQNARNRQTYSNTAAAAAAQTTTEKASAEGKLSIMSDQRQNNSVPPPQPMPKAPPPKQSK